VHALAVGLPPRPLTEADGDRTVVSLGIVNQDVVSATLVVVNDDNIEGGGVGVAAAASGGKGKGRRKRAPPAVGHRLGGSPSAAGVGGVVPSSSLAATPPGSGRRGVHRASGGDIPSPLGGGGGGGGSGTRVQSTFKGKRNKLGSSDDRRAVGVGGGGGHGHGDGEGGDREKYDAEGQGREGVTPQPQGADLVSPGATQSAPFRSAPAPAPAPAQDPRLGPRLASTSAPVMAAAAAAEVAGGGARAGAREISAEALDRRVARRTRQLAGQDSIATAAMLADPDDGDGGGGGGGGGSGGSSMTMAADLMRAAEGEAARASALDPTVASLQKAMQAVVTERAMEAEGNRKVSAALAGLVHFQALADGRLVVRYRAPNVGAGQSSAPARSETTEIVQDLPAGLLPIVLRVVCLDESPAARANLAPAMMAVASPRVFWAVVRHAGVGGAGGRRFEEAFESLAPGAANWGAVGSRERRTPGRYQDYVAH